MDQLEVFRSQWGEAADVWLNQADATAWVASLGDHLEERLNEAMLDLDSKVPGKYENFGVRLLQPSGVQQFLPCKGRTTLAQMQQQIYEKTGVEPERQRLVHKGKLLSHQHQGESSSSSPSLRRLGITTTSSVHLFPLPVHMLASRDAQTVLEASGAAALAIERGSAESGASNRDSASRGSNGGGSSSTGRAVRGEGGPSGREGSGAGSGSPSTRSRNPRQQREVSGRGAAAPPTVIDRAMVGALREAAANSARSSPRAARVSASSISSSASAGAGAAGTSADGTTSTGATGVGDPSQTSIGRGNASSKNNEDDATALWRATLLEDTQKYHMLLDLGVSRSTVLKKMVSDGIGSDESAAEELLLSTALAKAQEEEEEEEEADGGGLLNDAEDDASNSNLHVDDNNNNNTTKAICSADANTSSDNVQNDSSSSNSNGISSSNSSNSSNVVEEVKSPLRESAAAAQAAAAAVRAKKAALEASEAAAASQARAEAKAAEAVARAQPPSAPKPLAADAKFKRMLAMGVSRNLVVSKMTAAGLGKSAIAEILGEDKNENASSSSINGGSVQVSENGKVAMNPSNAADSDPQPEWSSSSSTSLLGLEELEHLEALITYSSNPPAGSGTKGACTSDGAGGSAGADSNGPASSPDGSSSACSLNANAGESARDGRELPDGSMSSPSDGPTPHIGFSSATDGRGGAPQSSSDRGPADGATTGATATASTNLESSEPVAFTPVPSVAESSSSSSVGDPFSSLTAAVSVAAEEFADAFEAMTSPQRNKKGLPLEAPTSASTSTGATSTLTSRFPAFLSPLKQRNDEDTNAAASVGETPLSTPTSAFGGGVLINKMDAEVNITWLLDAFGIKSPIAASTGSSATEGDVPMPPSPTTGGQPAARTAVS